MGLENSSYIILSMSFFLSYLCGSIPFGLLLAKAFNLGDIRTIGSGNIGATNVLRTGNKKVAAITLLLDMMKGFLPAFIFVQYSPLIASLAAFGAILGHCYPIWLKFKGGKGVATILGILIGLNLFVGLATAATWLVVAFLGRISSLSALIAVSIAPFYMIVFGTPDLSYAVGIMAILVYWRHRENIKRLAAGTEPKIGSDKKKDDINKDSPNNI